MRVIHRYILQDFLVIFTLTLLVFTFVMSIGALFKAIDLLARGISPAVIGKYFVFNIPYMLSFTIPMSTLTATLLLFGRLSMDGEITAMRSGGMNIWQIAAPVIFMSVVLTFICILLNYEVSPRAHFARDKALMDVGEIDPLDLLEEGVYNTTFPGLQVYVGHVNKSERRIEDVVINELNPLGIRRTILAKYGLVDHDKKNKIMEVNLYEVKIDQPDRKAAGGDAAQKVRGMHFPTDSYNFRMDLEEELSPKKAKKRRKDFTFKELLYTIHHPEEHYKTDSSKALLKHKMKLMVEGNKRMSLALTCFSFALLGIPLGMKSKRKESSSGIALSLALVVVYYFFIITAESITGYPEYFPDLLVWIPVFLAQIAGVILLRRIY